MNSSQMRDFSYLTSLLAVTFACIQQCMLMMLQFPIHALVLGFAVLAEEEGKALADAEGGVCGSDIIFTPIVAPGIVRFDASPLAK